MYRYRYKHRVEALVVRGSQVDMILLYLMGRMRCSKR